MKKLAPGLRKFLDEYRPVNGHLGDAAAIA